MKRKVEFTEAIHVTTELTRLMSWLHASPLSPGEFSYPCPLGHGTHVITWWPRLECQEDA